MRWPRKQISEQNSFVFLGFRYNSLSSRDWRSFVMFSEWLSREFDHTAMSSMYMWQKQPIHGCRAAVTWRWCIAGAFLMPMGITTHSYNPQGVFTAVKGTSSGCIRVWKKLFVMSSVANTFPCAQSARISLTSGMGKLSVTVFEFSRR